MLKTLSIISLTVLTCGMALEKVDTHHLQEDDPTKMGELADAASSLSMMLREGMGLMEVEKTLNEEGHEQRMVRSIEPETTDPLDWNVGWEIARTYEAELNGTREQVTAVFEAWTDESSEARPPESAFRLVRWN